MLPRFFLSVSALPAVSFSFPFFSSFSLFRFFFTSQSISPSSVEWRHLQEGPWLGVHKFRRRVHEGPRRRLHEECHLVLNEWHWRRFHNWHGRTMQVCFFFLFHRTSFHHGCCLPQRYYRDIAQVARGRHVQVARGRPARVAQARAARVAQVRAALAVQARTARVAQVVYASTTMELKASKEVTIIILWRQNVCNQVPSTPATGLPAENRSFACELTNFWSLHLFLQSGAATEHNCHWRTADFAGEALSWEQAYG